MPKNTRLRKYEKAGKISTRDRIKELEKELSTTKYNKKTQHAIGLLKAKIARLKEKQEARKKSGPAFDGYNVKKSGDATVIILGFPSVGKSTLLNALTNAKSQIAAYEFTTLNVIPGVMKYNSAKIQVLDVPGIVHGAASGKGRGKEVLSVLRNADLVIIILDVFHPKYRKVLEKEAYEAGLRLNQHLPDVKIKKTAKGGIDIGATVRLTHLKKETIKQMLKEFKLNNATIVIREDITPDQLIDVIEKNKKYLPSVTVLNKVDLISEEELEKIKTKIKPDLCISAEKKTKIDELKKLIFKRLGLMRIYLKQIGKKPDLKEPLIVPADSSIEDVCSKIHRDFITKFRFARVWGKSAKFPGQKLSLHHTLKDKDVLQLHMR